MRSLMRAASSLTELASARRSAPLNASRLPASVAAPPAMVASGVRRSCEIEASSALRIASVSARTSAAWAWAAKSARSSASPICAAKVSSSRNCSGSVTRRGLRGSTRQHAEHALAAGQRQIQSGGAAQRIGAQTRGLAVIEHPLRDAEIGAGVGELARLAHADRPRARARPGNSTTARLREHLADVAHGDLGHLVAAARHRQLPAHGIQQRGAPLAVAGDARLQAHAGVEIADDQRHAQHDGEGDQVLHVADGEGE